MSTAWPRAPRPSLRSRRSGRRPWAPRCWLSRQSVACVASGPAVSAPEQPAALAPAGAAAAAEATSSDDTAIWAMRRRDDLRRWRARDRADRGDEPVRRRWAQSSGPSPGIRICGPQLLTTETPLAGQPAEAPHRPHDLGVHFGQQALITDHARLNRIVVERRLLGDEG